MSWVCLRLRVNFRFGINVLQLQAIKSKYVQLQFNYDLFTERAIAMCLHVVSAGPIRLLVYWVMQLCDIPLNDGRNRDKGFWDVNMDTDL